MTRRKIIIVHLIVFLLLSTIFVLSSEYILNTFASSFHNVGLWLDLLVFGGTLIFLGCMISCVYFLTKKRKIELKMRISQRGKVR